MACSNSILKRAQDKEIISVNTVNFRDYAINKHNQVDDYPFGGGQWYGPKTWNQSPL